MIDTQWLPAYALPVPQAEEVQPLSPAAQAVLDAFGNASDGEYIEGVWIVNEQSMLAAALRSAADQVVPDVKAYLSPGTASQIRSDILRIAAELEGAR